MDAAYMSPEELRAAGHAVVDWVADYWESVATRPVASGVAPGEVYRGLDRPIDAAPEGLDGLLAELDAHVVPGLTHWQHPGFLAYFPANTSGPSVLGDLVTAGLGVQGMLWSTSPACTELETLVLDQLADLLDLPARFRSDQAGGGGSGGGVIQDSASSATLCALLAARERATGGAATHEGNDPRLTVYASAHAHSSVEKAVRIAGLGADALRLVESDAEHALRPDALDEALAADVAAGQIPCLVVATVGTTSSGALDPLGAVGEVAARHGAWLHVDAAWAGVAAICPELRGMHAGLERADSYCTNPHKGLLTGFDCDAFYVADRGALVRALSVLPEYLRNAATESGAVIDYRDWQIPLGRRFRALKLWFVLRMHGVERLRQHVRRHVALAAELTARIEAHEALELAAPASLSLVCFRLADADDAANQQLLAALNATDEVLLTHTVLDGRVALRAAFGAPGTDDATLERLWTLVDGLLEGAARAA